MTSQTAPAEARVRTRGIGVVTLLPEPLASHVQAWRRTFRDPAAPLVPPHLTLGGPRQLAQAEEAAVVQLVEQVAEATPALRVELRSAGTFLPTSPVAYLAVGAGAEALGSLEARLTAHPLGPRRVDFVPHVTIAHELSPARLERAAAELAGFRAEFDVRELAVLGQHDETKAWSVLHRVELGPEVREVGYADASSAAVFLIRAGMVLLGLRTSRRGRRYPGVWDGLGGKPEPGETLLQALIREAGEEAGVEPLDIAPLGCFDDGDRADAFFFATVWRGEPRNADPAEHSALQWVPLVDAPSHPLAPTTRNALLRLAETVSAERRAGSPL